MYKYNCIHIYVQVAVPHAPIYFPPDFSTQQRIDAVQAYLQELQYLFYTTVLSNRGKFYFDVNVYIFVTESGSIYILYVFHMFFFTDD